jgi:NAD-dependent deacetylase
MDAPIHEAALMLSRAKRVVALTGAGISVESGIPPFRGKGGLWEKIDPMEFAHIDAFLEHPEKVWRVLIAGMKEVIDRARPNAAHLALARLEQLGRLKTVITQNVDGLHQRAGSTDVIEFHGTFARLRCMHCHRQSETADIDLAEIPPRCACGGILRPECIFFGEAIPEDHLKRSRQVAAACELMLVIGTSATVQPAASMPVVAKDGGAAIVEINREPSPLTGRISDLFLQGSAASLVMQVVAALEARLG